MISTENINSFSVAFVRKLKRRLTIKAIAWKMVVISVNVRAVLGISNIEGWCCTSLSGAAWPAVHTKHHLAEDMPGCKNMRITRDEKRLLLKDMWPDSVTKWGLLLPPGHQIWPFHCSQGSIDQPLALIQSTFCVICQLPMHTITNSLIHSVQECLYLANNVLFIQFYWGGGRGCGGSVQGVHRPLFTTALPW